MTNNDMMEFGNLMKTAADITHTTPLSMQALIGSFQLLKGYSYDQIQQAVNAHLLSPEGKFFPTVSHISTQINGTPAERAELAWRVLLRAIDEHGYYDSVRFPEPAYHYAISMLGGWIKLSTVFSQLNEQEINFRRPQFISLFQYGERNTAFEPTHGKETVDPYLPGACECENRANGYFDYIPPVIEIGTGRKVKQTELKPLSAGNAQPLPDNATGQLSAQLGATKRLK